MCILEEIGFTTEQYMELHNKGIRDFEIAQNQLSVPLETLVSWKVKNNLEHDETKEKKRPYYFTVEEWEEKKAQGLLESEIAKEFGFGSGFAYYEYKDTLGIPKKTWSIQRTPELIEAIRNCAEKGMTQKETASKIKESLGVQMSSVSVGNLMKEYGIVKKIDEKKVAKNKRNRTCYHFTIEEWQAKKKEGKSEKEISKEFGFNDYRYYRQYRRKIGLPPLEGKSVNRTPELIEEIKGYLKIGLSQKKIAKLLKISAPTIGKIIREEGLE